MACEAPNGACRWDARRTDCRVTVASLAVATLMTCTATYTVTQADLSAGVVSNVATVTGTPGGPNGGDHPPGVSPPSKLAEWDHGRGPLLGADEFVGECASDAKVVGGVLERAFRAMPSVTSR